MRTRFHLLTCWTLVWNTALSRRLRAGCVRTGLLYSAPLKKKKTFHWVGLTKGFLAGILLFSKKRKKRKSDKAHSGRSRAATSNSEFRFTMISTSSRWMGLSLSPSPRLCSLKKAWQKHEVEIRSKPPKGTGEDNWRLQREERKKRKPEKKREEKGRKCENNGGSAAGNKARGWN